MYRTEDNQWFCVPVGIGPTWDKDPAWKGPRTPDGFILPRFTIGYQVILWIQDNLLNDEGGPFILTNEQKRFVLWWYSVGEDGRFLHPSGVLQRLKGWLLGVKIRSQQSLQQ